MSFSNTARIVTRARRYRSAALALAIPAIYVLVLGAFLLRKGDADWDQMLAFHQIELWNAKLFGIEKQWNPLMAGGMSLAGDPQVPVLSPSILLARLMPPAAAIKAAVLLFVAIGWAGAFLLARRLGLDRGASALAGSLFAGNGYILSHLSHGHTGFLGTLTLPLWLWAVRTISRRPGEPLGQAARRSIGLTLAGGVLFALSVDGEPMTILLLAVWVGLDGLLLALRRRSAAPLLFLAGAAAAGVCLDAIFLFPMVANQTVFPRWRDPVLLDPLLLLWFLVLPARGKVLPAPANGHEFSLYIGPALAYLLIRYRARIARSFPAGERRQCLALSALIFLVGLGAFRALGAWAPPGPFDLLHLLPGFRTVGIPARFWGYLALPLALAGAVAIRGLEAETTAARPHRTVWALLILFAIPFEVITLAGPFLSAKGRQDSPAATLPERIRAIANAEGPYSSQALSLKPDFGLIHAYNDHDYLRGSIAPGAELVRNALTADGSALPARAEWDGWNAIVVTLPEGGGPGTILFNQNFHPRWISSAGAVTRNSDGNLVLRLEAAVPVGAAITLRFHDPWSAAGKEVSRASAWILLAAAFVLGALEIAARRRSRRTAATPDEELWEPERVEASGAMPR
jgi:hypothetical protein